MKIFILLILGLAVNLSDSFGKTVSSGRNGYVIVEIQPGSIYETLGLKKGDILKSYNGKPIQGKKDIGSFLKNLFGTPGVLKLKIERNGKTEEFTYNIEESK